MLKRCMALIMMMVLMIGIITVPASAQYCQEVVYTDQFEAAQVYVDDVRVDTNSTYIIENSVLAFDTEDLWRIFSEIKGEPIFQFNVGVWANRLGYNFVLNGNQVFINKNSVPIIVEFEGESIYFPDQRPIVRDNRTFVPARAVAEMLGCQVSWNQEQERVDISRDGDLIVLWLNSKFMWHNGEITELDVEPFAMNERTMLPMRAIAEAFGLRVLYESGRDLNVVTLESVYTIQIQ